jgi:hypothetical protein
MKQANKSVETNRRPASPFEAGQQFWSSSCAPPSLSAAVAHLRRRSTTLHAMLRFVTFTCLIALAACSRNSAPKSSAHEVSGSSAERIAAVSAIITKHKAPPTAMLDARFLEEQTGDGSLGPSDFRAFYFVEVAPQDVARWTDVLAPLSGTAEYDAPAQPCEWWIARDAFASLQLYRPDSLTGRSHGWIGVSPHTGRIFIFTFTM